MELLVIVLCLLSERFLVHKIAHHRFHWFMAYGNGILSRAPGALSSLSSWAMLALIVLPFLFIAGIILYLFDHLLFGVVALIINIVVFYYCLGPVNPFYPVHDTTEEWGGDDKITAYLIGVNGQLFAVLFWYLVLGPIGILGYRLVSLAQGLTIVNPQALVLLNILDWIPARMTALLYLLVGNFQAGCHQLSKLFFTAPDKNETLLSTCSLAALNVSGEKKTMLQAENLVEHASIVFLALLAFCTIVAWV